MSGVFRTVFHGVEAPQRPADSASKCFGCVPSLSPTNKTAETVPCPPRRTPRAAGRGLSHHDATEQAWLSDMCIYRLWKLLPHCLATGCTSLPWLGGKAPGGGGGVALSDCFVIEGFLPAVGR